MRCKRSICQLNGCMIPQDCPNEERDAPAAVAPPSAPPEPHMALSDFPEALRQIAVEVERAYTDTSRQLLAEILRGVADEPVFKSERPT